MKGGEVRRSERNEVGGRGSGYVSGTEGDEVGVATRIHEFDCKKKDEEEVNEDRDGMGEDPLELLAGIRELKLGFDGFVAEVSKASQELEQLRRDVEVFGLGLGGSEPRSGERPKD
jgi:hypothetical protein